MFRGLCPQRSHMNALTSHRLADDEQRRLADHLDHCPDCQQRAEELTGTGPAWSDGEVLRSAPALRRVIDVMKDKAPVTARSDIPPLDDRMLLSFLKPAPGKDCLGTFGGYEVLEVLGRGGMGVVLKAFDPSLERFVAIKVLAPQLATSARARERFAREARAAAAINHEHVVAIYAVAEAESLPYLVMEYVPGLSLQERLDEHGPLPLPEILRLGFQVASGLAAAHAQGLVHRDIKPGNILLSHVQSPKSKVQDPKSEDVGAWTLKVSDFGLARTADDASLTQSGVLAGTPHYMAPEQARGETVNFRADLYSLGSVLYALCTGQPPFPGRSTLAVLRQVSETTPPPVRRLRPDLPEWLEDIISRLHAQNPADRFVSAAEIAELLRRCLAHVQEPNHAPLPAEVACCRRRRPCSHRWVVPVLLVVGTVGALAIPSTGPTSSIPEPTIASAPQQATPALPEERLSWVPVDPEHKVQVAGRSVRVPDASANAREALELNLRLPGQNAARILIFGLPGYGLDPAPCVRSDCPSMPPPCTGHPSPRAPSSQARMDPPTGPLVCLVFADNDGPAATLSSLGSALLGRPGATTPVVIVPANPKNRVAQRPSSPTRSLSGSGV